MDCSSGTKGARVGDTHHSNQNDGVEDTGENLDASKLDGNDERRATRLRALILVSWSIGGDDETDEEEVQEVEDGNTPYDLLGSTRDLLLRVLGLGGSQPSKLGASVGECSGDEDTAETVEAIQEGVVGSVPENSLMGCFWIGHRGAHQ